MAANDKRTLEGAEITSDLIWSDWQAEKLAEDQRRDQLYAEIEAAIEEMFPRERSEPLDPDIPF